MRTLGLFQVSRSKKGKYVVSCRQERENRAIGKLTLQGILSFQFRGKKKKGDSNRLFFPFFFRLALALVEVRID